MIQQIDKKRTGMKMGLINKIQPKWPDEACNIPSKSRKG